MKNRLSITTFTVTILLFFSVGYIACEKGKLPDPCANFTCSYVGTCVNGQCICETGYKGQYCDAKWTDKLNGLWLLTDSSKKYRDTFMVKVKQSLTETDAILFDDFGRFKVSGILAILKDSSTIVFDKAQNIYPGYVNIYLLDSGSAKIINDSTITGRYTIDYDTAGKQEYTFQMVRP